MKILIHLAILISSIYMTSAAIDCGSISCGTSTCESVCSQTEGCFWNSNGTDSSGMDCDLSDAFYSPSCCVGEETTTTTDSPTSASPTPSPTCPDDSGSSNPCRGLEEKCCDALSACSFSTSDLCQSEGGPNCCALITDEPTPQPTEYPSTDPTSDPTTDEPTTNEPTASPTCPDYSGAADPCSGYSRGCCPTDSGLCQWSTSDICQSEGGPYCCEQVTTTDSPTTPEPTTPSPTTPEPTTPSPTTPEPTTPSPTTPEPTTPSPTTPEPTTPEPTTPAPTTPEPTTPEPTTPAPTTPEPTTTTEAETTEGEEETTTSSPTKTGKYPTPRPTLPSAEKWGMIHPAYKGGDGELLWHVYYGDFSNDDRFDDFRKRELWDAQVIRPIIQANAKFARYQQAEMVDSNKAVSSTKKSSSSPSLGWMIIISLIFIGGFAYWYKYRGGDNKFFGSAESQSLLAEKPVSYNDYQVIH